MNIISRDVCGFEGLYQIHVDGRIFATGNGKGRRPRQKVPTQDGRGYLVVNLYKNNKQHRKYIHRLVAEAFVEGDTSLSVNHIDGDKLNNCPENLEWVSLRENTLHQHRTGLANSSSQYKPTKIPSEDYALILKRLAAGEQQKTIAEEYGCSQPAISWVKKQAVICQNEMR